MNDEYSAAKDKTSPLSEGKTASDTGALSAGEEEFIPTNGKNRAVKAETLAAVQKYVRALAEQAARQLKDGVIVPSPYDATCQYCDFAGICKQTLAKRKFPAVDTEFIAESAKRAYDTDADGGKTDDRR